MNTLIDLLSNTGGLSGMLVLLLGMSIAGYVETEFLNSILQKMYKYQENLITKKSERVGENC